jgi:hypothetical protein
MSRHEQLVARGREIIQDAPQAFIDIDVEADGVAGCGSLLSVGAVSPWGETFYAELQPTSERYVPSQRDFCDKLGLTRERLMDEGENPRLALRNLAHWAVDLTSAHDKQRPILAAFPASFDCAWIKGAMFEAGIIDDYPFGIGGFCLQSMAMALSGQHDWRVTSKGRLPAELLPSDEFTHNALDDAKYQQKMHFALAAALEEQH